MLAVFDSDHTLFCVNISFSFGRFLYRNGDISFRQALACSWWYLLHKLWLIDSRKLHGKIFKKIFKGKQQEFFRKKIRSFMDSGWKKLLNIQIYEILVEKQKIGHKIFILSNSPQFILDEIGKLLQVDQVAGTEYIADKFGVFVKMGKVLDGLRKKDKVLRYAEEAQCELKDISVYTDSFIDIPLLQIAGHAVCVNPDFRLRRRCRQNQWNILQTNST